MKAIEMLNITKSFSGFYANENINLEIEENEIHALLGENGAGKTTLMSILFGLYTPDSGEIRVNEKKVHIDNPNVANSLGIGMVHQHFKLIKNFTVTENIILGVEDTNKGILNKKDNAKKIKQLSEKYGLDINPDSKVGDITVGMQQKVEILKMLYRDVDILIFDEPTAVLTPPEIEEFIKIVETLKKEGKTILLITHKLKEIKEMADRCTIIRYGKYIDTVDVDAVCERDLAELMVGEAMDFSIDKKKQNLGDVTLDVKDLSAKSSGQAIKDITFQIRAGEIVGIAGVDGNGQNELVQSITGLLESVGTILINGKDVSKSTIRQRTECGLGHIPEDRHKHGLILDFTMYENMSIQEYYTPKLSNKITISIDNMKENAKKWMEKYDVRSTLGIDSTGRSLSGGNQQKAIIAREMSRNPDLLVIVQPTRGLDVGAIDFIHREIIAARDNGAAVLLVSFELDEIMNLSDSIRVMYEGCLSDAIPRSDAKVATLGYLMAGGVLEEGDKDEK